MNIKWIALFSGLISMSAVAGDLVGSNRTKYMNSCSLTNPYRSSLCEGGRTTTVYSSPYGYSYSDLYQRRSTEIIILPVGTCSGSNCGSRSNGNRTKFPKVKN